MHVYYLLQEMGRLQHFKVHQNEVINMYCTKSMPQYKWYEKLHFETKMLSTVVVSTPCLVHNGKSASIWWQKCPSMW